MASGDDLTAIEPWIGDLLAGLKPGARRKLAMQIGRHLRKENARRIAGNVQPDGSAMEPRKRRIDRKTGRVRQKGRMFRKLGTARAMKIRAQADGVELGFAGPAGRTAATHHFGDVGFVGKTKDGRTIRTRYPERRLLGFGDGDAEAIMDIVLAHLSEG